MTPLHAYMQVHPFLINVCKRRGEAFQLQVLMFLIYFILFNGKKKGKMLELQQKQPRKKKNKKTSNVAHTGRIVLQLVFLADEQHRNWTTMSTQRHRDLSRELSLVLVWDPSSKSHREKSDLRSHNGWRQSIDREQRENFTVLTETISPETL